MMNILHIKSSGKGQRNWREKNKEVKHIKKKKTREKCKKHRQERELRGGTFNSAWRTRRVGTKSAFHKTGRKPHRRVCGRAGKNRCQEVPGGAARSGPGAGRIYPFPQKCPGVLQLKTPLRASRFSIFECFFLVTFRDRNAGRAGEAPSQHHDQGGAREGKGAVLEIFGSLPKASEHIPNTSEHFSEVIAFHNENGNNIYFFKLIYSAARNRNN